MNPAGQPKSAKSLANKRRQLKLKILLLQDRLSTLEEDQQLPSMPEFRVFAKNIERFYGELDRVLREIEECDSFADERDAHDLECAAIEGLLQGVNNKIVALSHTLLSQPIQVTEQQQFQPLAVSQQVAIPTPHGGGECTGDGDIPEKADPAVAGLKVCAPLQPISSPTIETTERGDPLCTRCNGCHLSTDLGTDCFAPSEVPLGQSHETNSNLKALQSMPDRSLQLETPSQMHYEMQRPAEPEVVQHEASTRVRGDVDVSGDSDVTPTQRSEERIHGDLDVGWCQPVELGSLPPADAEREDAESDDPQAVARPETAGLIDEDPGNTTKQAVTNEEARSLQPAEADEVNVPSSAQPVCIAPAVQEDAATKPNHKSETYSCQLFNGNVARSTDRVRAASRFAEKLLQSVVFTSTVKKPRLVWDPGMQPICASHSTTQPTKDHHQMAASLGRNMRICSKSLNHQRTPARPVADYLLVGLTLEAEPSTRGENVRQTPKFDQEIGSFEPVCATPPLHH
ncbi:uncharacterized protein LOC128092461 [Culex pipiens pallens]|uniref:uncharacterized protein LOC128092461 n=1 Tax=Culex pipiens pallens TaxID=42434 RepID=UPI0022AB39AC|nr:uncharacterized protein LOC128092461 [Culex pipiens pallens]